MLSIGVESSPMIPPGHDEEAGAPEDPRRLPNLRRAGIKSFGFFIYGYPGDTVASMEQTTRYAIELDADFANFYRPCPIRTELHERCRREGC